MRTKVVDLLGVDSAADLHRVFANALEFPEYYGRDMDALWDCLRPERLELTGWQRFAKTLPAASAQILQMLAGISETDPSFACALI